MLVAMRLRRRDCFSRSALAFRKQRSSCVAIARFSFGDVAVADAASFFRALDAVFLLVQWRRCPADVVLAARDQVKRLGASLKGVIFNGFDARKVHRRGYGRYGYYGYYGYYGRYRGYGYGYGYGYGEERGSKKKEAEGEAASRR